MPKIGKEVCTDWRDALSNAYPTVNEQGVQVETAVRVMGLSR